MENPNTTLKHHGVLGMKWGVRRYQRRDGSLTRAGKRRYDQAMKRIASERDTLSKLEKLKADSVEVANRKRALNGNDDPDDKSGGKSEPSSNGKKSAKEMNDSELSAAINRLRLEQTYTQLYNQMNPQEISRGKKLVDGLKDSAISAITEGSKAIVKDAFTKMAKKALKLDDETANNAEQAYKKLEQEVKKLELQNRYTDAKKKQGTKVDSEAERLKAEAEKLGYESRIATYKSNIAKHTPVSEVKPSSETKAEVKEAVINDVKTTSVSDFKKSSSVSEGQSFADRILSGMLENHTS